MSAFFRLMAGNSRRSIVAKSIRLAPVLLVSVATLLLLLIPMFGHGATPADRSAIEQQILNYLSNVPATISSVSRPNDLAADPLSRTQRLLQVRDYRTVTLNDIVIENDKALVHVQLGKDDGTTDGVIFTCRRAPTGWHILAVDLDDRVVQSATVSAN
jgi:hypothetical protein